MPVFKFDKFDFFLGFTYKFYPLLLTYFIYFDYSVFVNVFNIESGYFYTIFSNDLFSGLILSYILIPIIFISAFFLFGVISFDFSKRIKNFIFKRISIDFKNIGIYKGILVLIFFSGIIFALYSILLILFDFLKNISFIASYGIFLLILMFIRSLIGSIYLHLDEFKFKDTSYFKWLDGFKWSLILEIVVFFTITLCIYLNKSNQNFIFSFIFYYSYHLFSYGYYASSSYVKNLEANDRSKKWDNLMYLVGVFLFIFIVFGFFDHINSKTWKESITINKEKKAFKDSNFNLLFNRGLLLNNKNNIKVKIPKAYLTYIDIDSVDYLNTHANEHKQNFIIYKIKDNAQYLNLTRNLKMYFQPIKNRTIVFLLEEKKFANKEGSEYILIELSDYEMEKNNIVKK